MTPEQLRGLHESPVPQSRVDLQGRVLAVNRALTELMGAPEQALLGHDALAMYDAADRPVLEQALSELNEGRTHFVQQERTLLRADGTPLQVVMTVTTMTGRDGATLLAGSVQDVTAVRAAERAALEQAERFDALLRAVPAVVWSFDAHGVCTSSSGRVAEQFGQPAEAWPGTPLLDAYADEPVVLAATLATLDGVPVHLVLDLVGCVWDCHFSPLRDDAGRPAGGLGIAVDVTAAAVAEREVRANERRLRALLRSAADVALVLDRQGRLLWASPSVSAHFGHDPQTLLGVDTGELDHPDDRAVMQAAWRRVLREPETAERVEARVRHADGTWRWTEHVLTNLLDDPDVGGVVVNVRDLSERRRAELELERRSLLDGLTGLGGRGLLLDRITQALVWGRRHGRLTGLVLLDVVGLARTNETLGASAGDEVLRVLAERLSTSVRQSDSVARVGGGTFAVLLEDVSSVEDLRARAAMLADAVSGPVECGPRTAALSLRVGVAHSPVADAGALLAAAERSLQRARATAAGDAATDTALVDTRTAAELVTAVAAGQLRLHLQPVVRLDGTMVAAEALVRWEHPERGLLPPAEFVPLAESTGLILDLGAWVLRASCRQAAAWRAAGTPYRVAVNLSARQLVDGALVELVSAVLAETGAVAGDLVLEVTESALMDDPGAERVLEALHDLGVRLALDDFGTGYSSLTYLKRFPVDTIKVDRSFVAGLGRSADDEAIVASVVSLARAVGKQVVAEGVEDAAQLAVLRSLGVDLAQGYLWSPALPADALDAWLAARSRPGPTVPAEMGADEEHVARILELHRRGASLHTVAAALNAEQRRTPDGRRWTTTSVARVIARSLTP